MSGIDTEIANALKAAGMDQSAAWKHPQSGTWVVYHWACERLGAHHKIKWETPVVVCADAPGKHAVVLVTGRLGDMTEWSFGEAAPYNTKQTYPFAMAEKRAKDRVILKLVGLHGKAYSEEEAEDFRDGPQSAVQRPQAAAPANRPTNTAPRAEPRQQPAQAPQEASKPIEFDPHAPKAAMTGKPAADAMQAFCGAFTAQVRAARTIPQLDELWSINETILNRVQEKNARAFDTVTEAFNARQAEVPGPLAGG